MLLAGLQEARMNRFEDDSRPMVQFTLKIEEEGELVMVYR